MSTRTSEFIASRSSHFLVNDARSTPFTIVCYCKAIVFIWIGYRFLFKCGEPFTSDERELAFLSAFQGCKEDPWKEGWSGIIGLVLWVQATIRLRIAETESTADLYHLMLLVTCYDFGLVFVSMRAGFDNVPLFYIVWLAAMAIYESFILKHAHRNYTVRQKTKLHTQGTKKD